MEQQKHIILASKSPRRQHLLSQIGIQFDVIPSSIREEDFPVGKPDIYVKRLAHAKADNVARQHPNSWVIGADSIVVIDNVILEKPDGKKSAENMLRRLSGREHFVFTGYSVVNRNKGHSFSEAVSTRVEFKKLIDPEIIWYIHTPEPYDKAGAYAIQGIGSFMVKTIHGSYTNVVGLPLCELIDHLMRHDIISFESGPSDLSVLNTAVHSN